MKLRIKQYVKIYFITLILVVIFDSVGTLQFDVGAGQVVIYLVFNYCWKYIRNISSKILLKKNLS